MNLVKIEMLSYRAESSVQYRNGWKTSGGSRTPGSKPSTALRLVQSTDPTLRTQIRTLIEAIPLFRHCVDEAHTVSTSSEILRLRSRLKRLTSLEAAAVEQQSDLLRYARDIFKDLFREICIICLICGDQPATRVGGPAFNGWQAQEHALWTRRRS